MREFEYKTWPEYYDAVARGDKLFEIRPDDREETPEVGDILHLRRYDPERRNYTGESLKRRVTYILQGGQFGLQEGYICIGVSHILNMPPVGEYLLLKDTLYEFQAYSWTLKAGERCQYFSHSDTYLFKARDGVVPFFGRNIVEANPDWFMACVLKY